MQDESETNQMNKKISWATDVHLDHCTEDQIEEFLNQVREASPDILLLTGDISSGMHVCQHLTEVVFGLPATDVYYVLGNHDYWMSSFIEVRMSLASNGLANQHATYLGSNQAQLIGQTTDGKIYLTGVDGWYDGQVGKRNASSVSLWDFSFIADLAIFHEASEPFMNKLARIAEEEADLLVQKIISLDLEEVDQIYIATHVPPWLVNATYRGKPSDADWAPWFVNQIMGETLENLADKHSNVNFTVLCGHSHGYACNQIKDNLVCVTAPARYENPKIYKTFEAGENWTDKLL